MTEVFLHGFDGVFVITGQHFCAYFGPVQVKLLGPVFGSDPCIQPSSFTMIWVSRMSVCTISTGPPNSCYASSSVGGLSVNVWIINPLKAESSTLGLSKIKRRNLTEIL